MSVKHKLHKTKKTVWNELVDLTGHQRMIIFVIVFAIVGSIILIATHAASPTVNLEAENGVVTNPAIKCGTDSTASNNNCVQFKKASAVTQKTNCTGSSGGVTTATSLVTPHLCGFADQTNTGIGGGVSDGSLCAVGQSPCHGVTMTQHTSNLAISGDLGSATTGVEVTATHGVTIDCPSGCTVTNLRLDGVCTVGVVCQSTDAITVSSSSVGVVIDKCEVQGAPPMDEPAASPLRGWDAIDDFGTSTVISKCNLHGFVGGIFNRSIRGTQKVINTFAHQVTCWNEAGNNSTCSAQVGGDHCNGFGGNGVSGTTSSLLIQDSTFYSDNSECTSAAVSFFCDSGCSTNANAHMVMNHNLLVTDNGDRKPWMSDDSSLPFTFFGWTANVLSYTVSTAVLNGPLRDAPTQACDNTSTSCYFHWVMFPMNASNNYDCGNTYDIPGFVGTNADNAAGATCPATLPWTPPAGYIRY